MLFSTPDATLVHSVIKHRRDVRGNNFLPTPLADGVLDDILSAAYHAPSVGLSQPCHFVVIDDIAIKTQIHHNFNQANITAQTEFNDKQRQQYQALKLEGILEAPINIAVYYQGTKQPVLGKHSMPEMGEYSVVCAIQNMWLMARALNVGLGWVSIIDPQGVNALLKAPEHSKLVGYLCLGYVKEFLPAPELELAKWASRKPLSVHKNTFT